MIKKWKPIVLILGLTIGSACWAGFYAAIAQTASPKNQADFSAKEEKVVANDLYGDPLPQGALLRLGLTEWLIPPGAPYGKPS